MIKNFSLTLLFFIFLQSSLNAQTTPALSIPDITVEYGQLSFEAPVMFESDSTVTAFQFDLLYDNTVINAGSINITAGNHLIISSEISPGTHRVLVYSPNNVQIENSITVILEFFVIQTGTQPELSLANIVLSDNSALRIMPASTDNGLVTLNPEDSDNDGIPDSWEKMYYSDLSVMNAFTDSDNDGCLDIHEFQASTDPTDNESLLKVMCPEKIIFSPDNEGLVLTWTCRPDKNYKIFWKETFSSTNWREVSYQGMDNDMIFNPDSTGSWVDLGKDPQMGGCKPLNATSRFYKIVIDNEN